MQPFHCDLQPRLQETHRTTHTGTTIVAKHIEGTKRPQPHPPHTRGTFHRRLQPLYTEKRKVSCSGFLPTTKPMQPWRSHSNAIRNHSFKKRIELRRQTQRLVAEHRGGSNHFPSSPLPFNTTSLPHHSPSSPLPSVTTSIHHHFPSSPLPIVTTSHRHHLPSSPPPFLTTPLHHHFPPSPLRFITTSHRHHFPSSPPPFFTTSLRHLLFFCYVLLCDLLCDLPPFIKVNCIASYSFVMYCEMTYHPSSFQVSEFYLSVTRKYCFPTSFDYIYISIIHYFISYKHTFIYIYNYIYIHISYIDIYRYIHPLCCNHDMVSLTFMFFFVLFFHFDVVSTSHLLAE